MKRIFLLLLLAGLPALAQSTTISLATVQATNVQAGGGGGSGPYSPSSFTQNNILIGNGTGPILASGATITNSGNTLTFAGASNLVDNGSGGLTLAAAGTNQSVTLTPSGSGQIIVSSSTSNIPLAVKSVGSNGSVINISNGVGGANLGVSSSGNVNIYGQNANNAVNLSSQTFNASSGVQTPVFITPTYNQTGSAGGTDLLINRTNTAVGSGPQKGIDLQIGGNSYFTAWAVSSIGTAQTAGLTLANTTASTSGATQQYSPAQVLIGHAWNTTATAADNYVQALHQLQVTSGTSPTGTLIWAFSTSATSTPSYTTVFQLGTNGNATFSNPVGAGTTIASFGYTGSSTAQTQINISNTNSGLTLGITGASTGAFLSNSVGALVLKSAATTALTLDSSQNATFAGNVTTAATGMAAAQPWNLGGVRTGTVLTTSTTQGLQVYVNGQLYTLAVLSTNP